MHARRLFAIFVLLLGFASISLPLLARADCRTEPLSPLASNLTYTTFPSDLEEWKKAPADQASWTLLWWCDQKYSFTAHYLVGFKNDIPGGVLGVTSLIVRYARASETERATLWNGRVCQGDACKRYDLLRNAAREQIGFLVPPQKPIWKVRPNPQAADLSRPVYNVKDGKRLTTPSGYRVAANEPCSCTEFVIEEGSSSYCAMRNVQNAIKPDEAISGGVALCGR